MSTLKKIFADASYCRKELVAIREAWGNRTTFSERMVEAARRTLGFMQFYGPESVQVSVEATLLELEKRYCLGLIHGLIRLEPPASEPPR